ncbi:MAG: hypothetical protein WBE05_06500 [Pseudolabrys sp.]
MRASFRQVVSLVAIYAVALHAILFGVAPVFAGRAAASDPFAIICHGDALLVAPVEQAPDRHDNVPGQACDHCNLCSVSAAPVVDLALAGHLAPTRLLQLLRPVLTSARSHLAITPHLARGPPIFA